MMAAWTNLKELSSLLCLSRLCAVTSISARTTKVFPTTNVIPTTAIRTISTCSVSMYKRRPPPPGGVPSWANYDGLQKCFDDDDAPKKLIWQGYRRNHKGGKPPQKTRKRCKRGDKLCSNPCPICSRSIEVEYKDTDILSQFISPHTNRIIPAYDTGVCRLQQVKLERAIEKARDYGLLPFDIPRVFPEEEEEKLPQIKVWNKIDIIS